MFGRFPVRSAAGAAALLALVACSSDDGDKHADDKPTQPPNILLVIMDDVGIDQMATFGYGGTTPPQLPNIDAIATAGLRFRNTWSMPECSPSRIGLFTGRLPVRTNVFEAIGENDLAVSQLSPYETTIPHLLKEAGYESGLFGKFHLAGPENNPAGNATPAVAGWDYFYGWVAGVPESIDSTAGGIAVADTYTCGFVPGQGAGGADAGACYYADNSCQPMSRGAQVQDAPGLQCLDSGGIFVPDQACGVPPTSLDFERMNGYYVSPLVILDGDQVEEVPPTDPRARGYRTRIEADAAIDWIQARAGSDKPWMATVSFTAAHTPIQQPPFSLVANTAGDAFDGLSCTSTAAGRTIQNRMTEALDTEFGRLLVETGLATRNADGSLTYDPTASNTVIVIAGDNGTLGYAVKQPFNAQRAKGSAYQTGVWIPLIVAGPQVAEPGRQNEHMVNMVDLFELFGELAGIDVHQAVPRTLDSAPMLAYLTDPAQDSMRTVNLTMGGYGIQPNGGRNGPCVLNASACSQIPFTQQVCEDNQGVWWGPGYTDPSVVANGGVGYGSCCEVNQALFLTGEPMVEIPPEKSLAIRDDHYKIVQNEIQHYNTAANSCGVVVTNEFYRINQAAPEPLLDNAENNLLLAPLPADQQAIYDKLMATLDTVMNSEPGCPGDGNIDGVVDASDVENWRRLAQDWGKSSVYDMRIDGVYDGLTNHADGMVIQQNLGLRCPRPESVS